MDTSEVLEYSKENIKPLVRGRKTNVLGTALQAEMDDEVRHNLLKKRDQYEIQLRSYLGDDPLQIWYEYVDWVEQNFPKNGREGNFQVLLERCVAEFKDVDKYMQDERYINIWIRYLNQFADNLEMYKQIHAHGIGTQCALFYESWAEALERAGDLKRADKVYTEGIQRKAEPLDKLVFAHERFQVRVARHILDEQTQCPESPQSDQRCAMALLKSHGRKPVVNNVRVGSSIKSTNPGILLPHNNNSREKKNIPQVGPKVFNDENADYNDIVSDHIIKTTGLISRREQIVKENTKKAGRWNEQKLKQHVVVPTADHVTFPVHVDEGADITQPVEMNVVINALKPKRFDEEASIPVALFEAPDPTKRPMYPKHKVYSGGTEFSLEELRAMKYNEEYGKRRQKITVDCDLPSRPTAMNMNDLKSWNDVDDIPIALFEPPDPTKRPMYPKHKVYSGGTEFSLEELRAVKYNEEYERKQREKRHQDSVMKLSECEPKTAGVFSIDEIQIVHKRLQGTATSHKILQEEFKMVMQHVEPNDSSSYGKEIMKYFCNGTSQNSTAMEEAYDPGNETVPINFTTTFACYQSPDEVPSTDRKNGQSFPVYVDSDLSRNQLPSAEKQIGQALPLCVDDDPSPKPLPSMDKQIGQALPLCVDDDPSPKPLPSTDKKNGPAFSLYVDDDPSPKPPPSTDKQNGPAFSLYVDDEDYMKEVGKSLSLENMKQKQVEKVPKPCRPPPLPSFSMGGFLANELKLPKLQRVVDPEPEQSDSCESSGKIEQSFTVTTKEAMNVVHGLFKSPQSSFVQLPPPSSKPMFTILMDDSSVQENILTAKLAPDPDKPFDENKKESVPENTGFKLPALPYIPSPGRTRKELEEMEPEDKENGLSSVKKLARKSCLDPSRLLQPSKHIPFQPFGVDPAPEEKDDDLGVAPISSQPFDETCNTQAFARTLISSTPYSKNVGDAATSSARKLKTQELNESFCTSKPNALPEKMSEEPVVFLPRRSVPLQTPGASLSVIMETSRECKSSSTSSGSKCSTKRLTTIEPVIEDVEESRDQGEENVAVYPFAPNIISEMLTSIGFPARRHQQGYIKLPGKLTIMGQNITLGEEEYQCSEYPDGWCEQELRATEIRSGRIVSLKARKTSCPWEYYISQEIKIRLKESQALYFKWIEKGFFFTKGSVMVSEYSQYGDLCYIQNTLMARHFKWSPLIIMYWTYEMLDILKHLHKCKIIHGDLWVQNLYLHHIPLKMDGVPSLKLRHFEQAIDMEPLEGTKFCVEESIPAGMEKLFSEPISYEMDIYKVAASIYYLKHFDYLNVFKKNGDWTFKSNRCEGIWQDLIKDLLNASYPYHLPDLSAYQTSFIQQTDLEQLFRDFSKLKNIL